MEDLDDRSRPSKRVNRSSRTYPRTDEIDFMNELDELEEFVKNSKKTKSENIFEELKSRRSKASSNTKSILEAALRSKRESLSNNKKHLDEQEATAPNSEEAKPDKKAKRVQKKISEEPSKVPEATGQTEQKEVKKRGKQKKDNDQSSKGHVQPPEKLDGGVKESKTGPSNPTEPKKNQSNGDPIEEKVKEYLRTQNRPYSIINVFDNLHGKVKKSDLQKALDNLAASGEIICKEFGKSQVYFYNQSNLVVNQELLEENKQKFGEQKGRFEEAKRLNKELKAQLSAVEAIQTTENLQKIVEKYVTEIPELKTKLELFVNGNVQLLPPDQVDIKENELQILEKEKIKRRKIFRALTDTLLESTGLPKKKLAEKIGIIF